MTDRWRATSATSPRRACCGRSATEVRPNRLHRVTCPSLSLWGEQDELLPVGVSARWSEKGIPVEIVAGAGHLLEWDAPDEVGARLVEFLRDSVV